MSPWDLEPIDKDRRPNSVDRLPVLPSEIVRTFYRPRPEDWGGDRDSECKRISAALSQVMKLAIAEPFVSFVDLNLCPYPVDLFTIKSRLDNRFYRRTSAVEFDVNYIYTNARMFNQPESDIVRSASIIIKSCMKFIRNNTAVAKYQMRIEGTDETAYGLNTTKCGAKRNGTTSNIRPRSRRSSQHIESECMEIIGNRDAVDVPTIYQRLTRSRRLTTTHSHSHQGPSGSRNPQPSKTHQSIRPVPSPPNPTSASSGVRSAASSPNDCHTSPGSDSIGSGKPSPESQGKGNQSLPYTLKWINGVKYFECNVCTKTFSFESHLDRHLAVHTSERPFKCKICKKRFAAKSNLEIHFRVHTGERPFKCKICKKRFAQMPHLKSHVRVHTGERPFKCQVCDQSFTQSSSRKSHMQIHTGEKPFSCDICKKRFSRKSGLKLHKQRQHINEQPYKCGGCQKKYVSASRLRNHWKTSNCEPSSVDELSLSDSNDSDVEGNNCICRTISTAKNKFKNFSETNIRLCTTGMGDTEEERSDSLANQQQNDRPQSRKGKSLAPTNSKMSQLVHSTVGALHRRPLEDEEETSSESPSSSHSESSSDDDEESNRYFVFFLHFIRFLFICIFTFLFLKEGNSL